MTDPILKLDHVSKQFSDQLGVADVSLTVNDGEFFVLVGSSGSGKTTTLRMINRLIEPSSGTITFHGKNTAEYNLRELRTSIGYVLQDIALFPNMTVQQNVSLIPEMRGKDKKATKLLAEQLLREVDLDPEQYLQKMPADLSGGEQQRVGILRAFAANPKLILMDEPFSALDPISRRQLRELVKKIHENTHSTIIFVTHDMDEALELGDKIAVMRLGKVEQIGSPSEIVSTPANDFVAKMFSKSLAHDIYGVYLNKLALMGYLTQDKKTTATVPSIEETATVGDVLSLINQAGEVKIMRGRISAGYLTQSELLRFMADFQKAHR